MAKKQKFLRAGYWEYSKLGLRRKKIRKYRRANGIDNKVRLRMKGHLRNVSIGFRSEKETRDNVKGLKPVRVSNLEEIKKVGKEQIAIIANIGNKKKYEMMEYAVAHNIKVYNVNPKKFIEKIKELQEKKKHDKLKREEKKKSKDKKSSLKKTSEKDEDKKHEEKKEEGKEKHEHTKHKHEHKEKIEHESTK